MQRPTIHDVAREARVSLATVDRVLNNRGGVAAKSVEKVHFAVEKTGYVRDQFAANLSRGRGFRFVFLLPAPVSSFVRNLTAAIADQALRYRKDRVEVEVRSSPTFDSAAQVAALRAIAPAQTDCLAVMVTDVPAVRAELLRLRAAGVHILTLVSDVGAAARAVYVGPDNEVAGRMAGRFMGRFVRKPAGPVLVIAGSLAARDHAQRLLGFRQVLQAEYPALTVLPVAEGLDDADRIAGIALQAMADVPLLGIYAIGAGNAGLLEALSEAPGTLRPVTILHELTGTTRTGLQSDLFDLVIDQDPGRAVTRALSIMRDLADGQTVSPDRGNIPLSIIIKENIQ
ncbi:transcriptional regulator, LacI family [Loktanella fryxellensis]|uniref:Transcriptional regulator, LacI family n=1 Tax=Loktanella fryxellensis TaxID=245187 RepID=A0A1H8CKX5_9RHOB|nr:LacI family DNA-binding transcriptional regulator [Loktanella fryxellensis]SEM95636.1 transcriptional regulator, LacI family [Loktanella fryxellensis]